MIKRRLKKISLIFTSILILLTSSGFNFISVVEANDEDYKFEVSDIFKYNHDKKELEPVQCVSDKFMEKLLDYGMPIENIGKIKEIFKGKVKPKKKKDEE